MLHYIYDGSFDGLLTSIYEAYYRRGDIEDIVPKDSMEEKFSSTEGFYFNRWRKV